MTVLLLSNSCSFLKFYSEPTLFQAKAICVSPCSRSQQRQSRDTVAAGKPK